MKIYDESIWNNVRSFFLFFQPDYVKTMGLIFCLMWNAVGGCVHTTRTRRTSRQNEWSGSGNEESERLWCELWRNSHQAFQCCLSSRVICEFSSSWEDLRRRLKKEELKQEEICQKWPARMISMTRWGTSEGFFVWRGLMLENEIRIRDESPSTTAQILSQRSAASHIKNAVRKSAKE